MDHKLMYYPGTELYNRALTDGIIKDDYIDKVLLTRKTTRDKREDTDNDAFILALFGWAVKKNNMGIPNIAIKVLRIRQLFNFIYRFNILKYLTAPAMKLRDFLKKTRNKILT